MTTFGQVEWESEIYSQKKEGSSDIYLKLAERS